MECEAAAKSEMPNLTNISHLRDLAVADLKGCVAVGDLKALPINRLILFTTYLSRISDLEGVAQMYRYDLSIAVSELSRRFIDLKAFAPCLTMLKNYDGDSLVIEKCKVLIAKGEYNTAEHHLHVLLQSMVIRDPTDEIEARCLLAELLADHKNMLDEAIILLQKGRERIEKLTVRSESRLRIFLLLHQLAARQLTGIEEHMESRAFRMREDAIREWTRQRNIASQGAPTHAGRRIECELKCEREAVEAIKQKLVATAVDTVWAGLEALNSVYVDLSELHKSRSTVAELLSEPYLKQPQQPKQRNDSILRHVFPLIDVIFRFDDEKNVVKTFRMYVASGMVPAIWVHVVGHLMSHCFTKSILAPVIRSLCMPGDYSGDELIKWGPMERICIQADGLSAPKVLRTKGSDGKLYKLIWKNEDVRQDCLVEQLFSIVNSILNDDEDAAFLRTYKVVPLDSKCGIIEFCQGTTSLKQLLCGLDLQGGLHAEEEPQDEKAIKMRNVLKDAAKSPGNQASVMFQEACARFQPVFRHFFYRNYTTVREWTKMINNYRRSLAQWSIGMCEYVFCEC
ncbi:hypothetical protein ANCCAN_23931 [Ancylostoma caninum]|uniref:PI3K/PI4K catalytic domain-containing protein n=1 Tax=Ancylostoma caninum TaxID=29170 RepID=A0A368FDN0_ANCCA|nr:hypothetical protein ANCCAN_23931 [Ancylostoma caninum]